MNQELRYRLGLLLMNYHKQHPLMASLGGSFENPKSALRHNSRMANWRTDPLGSGPVFGIRLIVRRSR